MLENFFNYIFFSSIVLIYGAGIEKTIQKKFSFTEHTLKSVRMLLCVCGTSVLSYLFCYKVLFKFDLVEMQPFVSILIFFVISFFIDTAFKFATDISTDDFGTSFIIVLVSLTESFSVAECVLLAAFCSLAYFLFIPLTNILSRRSDLYKPRNDYEHTAYILISVSILILLLLAVNVSWLNPDVFS